MSDNNGYTENQIAALKWHTKKLWEDSNKKLSYEDYHEQYSKDLHFNNIGINKIEDMYKEYIIQTFSPKKTPISDQILATGNFGFFLN